MNKCIPRGTAPITRCHLRLILRTVSSRSFTTGRALQQDEEDGRIKSLGRDIKDEYAMIRDNYQTPKNPIVLAHGLLGFSELTLSPLLPTVQYWHGIHGALTAQGATVITATVPPSSSIEQRAAALRANILAQVRPGQEAISIVAHSMGGLDARHLISHLTPLPGGVRVAALVTVATPHRGSAFADFLLDERRAAPIHLPKVYGFMRRVGLETGAFDQLTQRYMQSEFNPATPDRPDVRYFSYGAAVDSVPLLSPFRQSHAVIAEAEGRNDGLVSVDSSRWGDYQGTLLGVSHLDLINWSNRMRWTVREWMGMKRNFNAVAFYLSISDMLAREGF